MNYIIVLITFISLLYSSYSEGMMLIRGTVIDSQSLIPLDKAEVVNLQTNEGTVTDSLGNFILTAFPDELNEIKFSYIGYSDIIKEIRITNNQKITVRMNRDNVIGDPVAVTGLYLERPLSNSPVITEIISNKEIKRFSNSTLIGLLEKVLPNTQVVNDSHGTTMKIQGLDSKYFLFLIDGNRMTGETTGNIDFSRLNLSDIDRIEIVNGGASASYGSGAIGGVINIITKKGSVPFALNFGTKLYSKNSDVNHWVSTKMRVDNLISNSSISYKGSDGFKVDGDIVQNTFKDISLNQSLEYQLNNKLGLYFSGSYYTHETEDYNYNNKRRDKYYDKQYIVKLEYLADEMGFKVNMNINNDNYEKFTLFEMLNDEERIRSRHRLNLFSINFSKKINNSHLFFGYENYEENFYSPTDLDYNPFAGYLGSDSLKSSILNSIFIQSEFYFKKDFQIISGFRYDKNSLFGNHIGPHFSVMYKSNNLSCRFNISKNFRSPSLKELYMSWDHLGMFYVRGNENLQPEKSDYISTSIEFSKPKFNLTIKPYFYHIRNMIVMVENLENNEMVNKNFGSVDMPGLDIYTKFILGDYVRISTTLSISEPKDSSTDIQVDGTNRTSLSNIISLFNDSHSFNISQKYLSSTFYSYRESIPDYYVLNLSYIFTFNNNINFSIGVDNLENTVTKDENLTVFPNKRFFANISFNYN